MTSLRKYYGEQHDDSGARLLWPGTGDGFPVRLNGNTVPNLKQHEFEDLPLRSDFRSDRFRLWVPEEKARFDQIKDKIENGVYTEKNRHDNWVEEKLYYVVWLEWSEVYGEIPHDALSQIGNGQVHGRQPPVVRPVAQPLAITPVSRDVLGYPEPFGYGESGKPNS